MIRFISTPNNVVFKYENGIQSEIKFDPCGYFVTDDKYQANWLSSLGYASEEIIESKSTAITGNVESESQLESVKKTRTQKER